MIPKNNQVQEKKLALAEKECSKGAPWAAYDFAVEKKFLDHLPMAGAVQMSEITAAKRQQSFRMRKLASIVYDRNEDNLDKLNSVFSSIHDSGSALFVLLDNCPVNVDCSGRTDVYVGVRARDYDAVTQEASEGEEILFSSFAGNFPGIDFGATMDVGDADKVLRKFLNKECRAVAAITGVPSFKHDDVTGENFTQGLEKLVEAMGDKRYMALLLAEPVARHDLSTIEQGYQDVYSRLSAMNPTGIMVSEQQGVAFGKSVAESLAKGIAEGIAKTNTVTETKTHSVTKSNSKSVSSSTTGSYSQSFTLGGTTTIQGGVPCVASGSQSINYSSTSTVGVSQTLGASYTWGKAETDGTSTGTSKGITESLTESLTRSSTLTDSKTNSFSKGVTCQYGLHDKRVSETLKVLDEQLERVRIAKNYGAWNWGAYLIAEDVPTVKVGANVFSGVFRGESSGVERNAISVWHREGNEAWFNTTVKSLAHLQHPVFMFSNGMPARITSLLSSRELTVGMSLPQKSLPGLPVLAAAEFGRSVSVGGIAVAQRSIEIGSIFHLGKNFKNIPVSLDVDSLSGHMFVTGSTGSGKSTAVYRLLDELTKQDVKFLVVEPAKGEYKGEFGGRQDVHVYGTNPGLTPLLRINPFSFPVRIHVMEHIDRLIEILNAVWPMYSAMPAILKDAVEKTYERLGWNLLTSENKYSNDVFPDFHDLLEVLPKVIQASEYDREVKSNYAGALLTRVRSLTNGYYRTILQKEEVPAASLFDENCIIDISRVGSSETKSFLMGIVFLKLQEYRMANSCGANTSLRHVTVLEEAHNLLRNTAQGTSVDSANLQGKSVEMLTNAIAEMRTYGEGFIIADQSPGLLDPAVIRNTNTKVVLRLPDREDRNLVGKAENLTEDQISELARLPTGCAAVYQNNWQEAVLCQISRSDGWSSPFIVDADAKSAAIEDGRVRAERLLWTSISRKLRACRGVSKRTEPITEAEQEVLRCYYPWVQERLMGNVAEKTLLKILDEQLVHDSIESLPKCDDCTQWVTNLFGRMMTQESVAALAEWEKDEIARATMQLLSEYAVEPNQRQFFADQCENARAWRIA